MECTTIKMYALQCACSMCCNVQVLDMNNKPPELCSMESLPGNYQGQLQLAIIRPKVPKVTATTAKQRCNCVR